LRRHRHVDHLMARKYGMEFEDFIARRLVKERDFSWDVASDAMNWESGMRSSLWLQSKPALVRMLCEHGYARQDILEL
jgi:hypothetical protein